MSYLITRVDWNNQCSTADRCLTPLRWLCGGRSYVVIESQQTGKIGAYTHERLNVFTQIVLALIGLLATIILFPMVLLGMAYKAASSNERLGNECVERCLQRGLPVIRLDQLSIRPKSIALTDTEWEKIDQVKYDNLVTIWDEVSSGMNSETQRAKKRELKNWLEKEVPDTSTYTHIPVDQLETTKILLERNLRFITCKCQDPETSFEKKRDVLGRLCLVAAKDVREGVCTPTWVEVTDAIYEELKDAGGYREKVLRWVQAVKEDLLLLWHPAQHWNFLNSVRALIGFECGLRYEMANYDDTVGLYRIVENKEQVLKRFLADFTIDSLIKGLIPKIRKDTTGAFDHDLNVILGRRIPSDVEDETAYLLKTFYDEEDGKYYINETGVKELLLAMELVEY